MKGFLYSYGNGGGCASFPAVAVAGGGKFLDHANQAKKELHVSQHNTAQHSTTQHTKDYECDCLVPWPYSSYSLNGWWPEA